MKMNNKISHFIKVLLLVFIGFIVFAAILFFTFIAPYRATPILMYHSISNEEQKSNILSLDKKAFISQMEYLSGHSYKIVPLKTLVQAMRQGKKIAHNWVVLTFDDGFRDFYTNAYPVLKTRQFNAAMFVYIDKVGRDENSLTWQDINKLQEEGLVDIGTHSLSHASLVCLSPLEARQEILESKSIIEERLKRPITFFSYPFGALNDGIIQMVKQSGYEAAVGTAYRKGEFKDNDIFILRRVFVSKISKHPFVFRFMLSGYYIPSREFILRVLNIKTPRGL